MATLGQQLKAARNAQGISEQDASTATKTLTKIIIAMEADDFSVMPAPAYAKGFIRLYAQYLGLDPAPLVEEYLAKQVARPRTLIDLSSQLEQNTPPENPFFEKFKQLFRKIPLSVLTHTFRTVVPRGLSSEIGKKWNLPCGARDIRVLASAIAAFLVLLVLISSISTCARRHEAEQPETFVSPVDPARILLDEPLPDLYLIEPGHIESSR